MKPDEYIDKVINENSPEFLTEGAKQSLSRVLSHAEADTGFGIVTPFRKDASEKINFDLLSDAETIARTAGFGFFKVRGYWYEKSPSTDEKKLAEEISLFIPNHKGKGLFDVLIQISKLSTPYQDGFIYSHDGTVELWEKQKNNEYIAVKKFTKFTPANVEEMLKKIKEGQLFGGSALRDKEKEAPPSTSGFYFESFLVQPGGSIGAMTFGHRGYIY